MGAGPAPALSIGHHGNLELGGQQGCRFEPVADKAPCTLSLTLAFTFSLTTARPGNADLNT
jgi:hypothetical protein